MLIECNHARAWIPAWYMRHVLRRVNRIARDHPGPERLVVVIAGAVVVSPHSVTPSIEPDVRRLLNRVAPLAR